MKKKSTTSNLPKVGDGATIQYHSDRHAGTVIQVTQNGRRIVVQEDKATRTDSNGMSESQTYTFEPDPQGSTHIATLRKDGTYRLSGGKTLVNVGVRSQFYDYFF
jgi:hypothetical protein